MEPSRDKQTIHHCSVPLLGPGSCGAPGSLTRSRWCSSGAAPGIRHQPPRPLGGLCLARNRGTKSPVPVPGPQPAVPGFLGRRERGEPHSAPALVPMSRRESPRREFWEQPPLAHVIPAPSPGQAGPEPWPSVGTATGAQCCGAGLPAGLLLLPPCPAPRQSPASALSPASCTPSTVHAPGAPPREGAR